MRVAGLGAGSGGLDNSLHRFRDVLVQADLLMDDFAIRIEDGDEIRVSELAAGFALVFHAEQRGEFEGVIRGTTQQSPATVRQFLARALCPQNSRRVALHVDGHEREVGPAARVGRERVVDALEIVNDERAGELATRKNQRDDLHATGERAQLDLLVQVGGPGGVELIK